MQNRLNKPFASTRKFKKFDVFVKQDNKIKKIYFGDIRYEDYTQHKDKARRKSFRARHGCDPVSKLDKTTPKYWSCQYLWNNK